MSQGALFEARLTAARTLSPSVRELVFERTDGEPLEFKAGQFVKLVLPIGEGLKRSYSIASAPDGSPRFALAVTRVIGGPGSTYLHEMSPGDSLTSFPPQGVFTRDAEHQGPSLFIATGTGLAPLWSMICEALRRGDKSLMWLIFGVRIEEEILYREEMLALAAEYPNFRPEFTLSRPADGWNGRRGYVQTHLHELLPPLVRHADGHPVNAYICGLNGMVSGARKVLREELQVPRENVHSERYD